MFENVDLESLESDGFIGAIACNANGAIIDTTSDDLEVFGSILGYISQVADMIGEPFGMDSIEEVHFESANTKSICIPQDEESVGILCNSRANVESILSQLIN